MGAKNCCATIWIHPDVTHKLLARLSTARGSITELVPVGPTKVKACKSVLFTEGTPEVEIKNKAIFALVTKNYFSLVMKTMGLSLYILVSVPCTLVFNKPIIYLLG